jgi:integrase
MATFEQKLSEWKAFRCLGKRPKTLELYELIHNFILKYWQDTSQDTSQIQPADVLQFAEKISGYSETYWNNSVCALRSITPHGKLLKRRPVKIRDFVPLTREQYARFLAECDAARSHVGLIVRFLAMTGLRISEARGILKIDVYSNGLRVRAEISKNGKVSRFVPFIPGVLEIIHKLMSLPDTGIYLLPRTDVRKAITNACKRAEIPRMSYHCFRHSFGTWCIQGGVDVPTVARWLGHQDGGALAAKTYFHLGDDHSRRMADRVSIAA